MKKRTFLGLMAATPTVMLTGCGGGNGSGSTNVRLVNVNPYYKTTGAGSGVDLWLAGAESASDVAFGTVSGWANVTAGSMDLVVKPAGTSSTLISKVPTLTKNVSYTYVLYGWSGDDAALSSFAESESAPGSGESDVAVLNASIETTAALDVYLLSSGESLDTASTFQSSISGATRKAVKTWGSGSYTLCVTAAGDKTDVRLSVALTLASATVYTLILAPGGTGGLVDAYLLAHGGSLTPLRNTQARVRVVPAVAGNGTVSLTLGSQQLMNNFKSPWIGDYALVDAASGLSAQATVNGTALSATSVDLEAGYDYTLLVSGSSAADAAVTAFTDDNRLPTTSGKFKLRMIHAAPTLSGDAMSLTLGSGSSITATYRAATKSTTFSSGNDQSVLVETQTAEVYNNDTDDFTSRGVYTAFVWPKPTSADANALQVRFHADR